MTVSASASCSLLGCISTPQDRVAGIMQERATKWSVELEDERQFGKRFHNAGEGFTKEKNRSGGEQNDDLISRTSP